ncbi:MAG: Isoquinoline 1-oxidoreductase subunit beta [Fimbriimonadaceae bacterium]|nr:Isoquinoline 1-oxidoreductase subunit beta [Fimbriimonadaceae bacterium]
MNPTLTRRTLLKVIAGTGATFVLGGFAGAACGARASSTPFAPNAFLKIDPDGTVTVMITRSDMGQGVRTGFAMLVAEELDADWAKVKAVNAPGDDAKYGRQGTGGSSSTRGMNRQLRTIGASARLMLVAAAAKKWGVDAAACRTESGRVLGPEGKSIGYGELAEAAQGMPVPENVQLKDKSAFKILGKPTKRVDNSDVVTGKAIFAGDVSVPGMVFACCLRPPAFGAKPETIDDKKARAVTGVTDIITIPSGIAVIAKTTWAALKGRSLLNVIWSGGQPDVTTSKLRKDLKAAAVSHKEMAGAKVIEASFELPYLAHATMEPPNAVADVRADACEVWTGTQSPDSAQGQIARALDLAKEKVKVNNTLLGGGFGRKFSNEWIMEAVDLSRRVKKPVKLLWTRECDMQHDAYRPMSEHAMKAALDEAGNPTGWSHQYLQAAGARSGDYRDGAYLPYNIPGAAMRAAEVPSPVPTGPWRSVEHTQIVVANECFIDELAHAAGADPLAFRLKLMKSDRLRKVLDSVAKHADWGAPVPKGSGRGVACFEGYGSCIAHVVDVTVKGSEIQVTRMVAVVDPGLAVNPLSIEAQVQGAFMDGISTALKAKISVEAGGVVEDNWHAYEWARMLDAPPRMEVFVEESGGNFGGMGEVGYPSSPAAIANAVFAATRKRARKFPIRIEDLV